ncbi:MAG: enoyl-CoA hydratase/isomerase family protein [Deltaproteobacteria bacterium]|nr:enoyl-CoA hydratase/isomerase family protein [Deltaproteobacteria bacterium]MBW2323253.1 enoyl-CoA hydratase/isomerase family protein [Deltaproteobacteria bacterium]
MSGKKISYIIDNDIAIITINNPPMNAMSMEVWGELDRALNELDSRKDEIKVVIMTGKGKAFVVGADIKSFLNLTQEKARSRLKKTRRVYLKLERFERPVICAVNGYCLGAGLELAMCCDIRIASTEAKFGQPEINLGIIPGGGGTQRLSRLVGVGLAKELIYTGKSINAERAADIGLVNRVVNPEGLINDVLKTAELIASKPPLAVGAAKEVIDRGLNMSLMESLEIEAYQWSYLCGTNDQKEGALAFLEKRQPKFTGR